MNENTVTTEKITEEKRDVSEGLIKLHRVFTSAERVQFLKGSVHELRKALKKAFKRIDELVLANKSLRAKNAELQKKIHNDALQFPTTLRGKTTVSVQAYLKLKELTDKKDAEILELHQKLNLLDKQEIL